MATDLMTSWSRRIWRMGLIQTTMRPDGCISLGPDIQLSANDTTHAMTIIYGTDEIDHSGSCMAVGDIDGDGRDDIIIGSGALGTLRNVYDRGGR